jgi:hypothetical protein
MNVVDQFGNPIATAAGQAVGQAVAPHAAAIIPPFNSEAKRTKAVKAAVRENTEPTELHWGWKALAFAGGFALLWAIMHAKARSGNANTKK